MDRLRAEQGAAVAPTRTTPENEHMNEDDVREHAQAMCDALVAGDV
jgi:hypothetical protein